MNIDDYRAMVAEAQAAQVEQPQVKEETKPVAEDVKPVEPIVEEKPKEVEKIVIDGVGELTLEELKLGYLRNSDYTKKTQDVAKQRKENEEALKLFNIVKDKPEIIQSIANTNNGITPILDPTNRKIAELEEKIYDMMLEKEIEEIQSEFKDFDSRQIVQFAYENKMSNLRDAYLLYKSKTQSTPDVEELKKQIREEAILELNKEKDATRTIIAPTGVVNILEDKKVNITPAEHNVALKMDMTDEQYVLWRDKK